MRDLVVSLYTSVVVVGVPETKKNHGMDFIPVVKKKTDMCKCSSPEWKPAYVTHLRMWVEPGLK